MKSDENTNTVKARFSIGDLLVLTVLIALFFAVLSCLLWLTNGSWELALLVAIVSFAFVLWRCLGARCSNCGRWWRKCNTGASKSGRGWSSAHLEEFECKNCGKTEWRHRLPNSGGGGGG